MKKSILLLALLASFAIKTTAQTKADKDQKMVAEAVESFRKAMVDGDGKTLATLAAEELTYGHSGGNVENKAHFVEAFTTGKSDFVKIDLSEQTVQVVGKTAIVRHRLEGETKDAGKEPASVHLRVLTVWQKQKGGWKLLARQAVKILQ
jgi:ketosteroid isomerase-like protein